MSASPEDAIVGAAWAALHDDPTVFDAAMFLAALRAAGYAVVPVDVLAELADDLEARVMREYSGDVLTTGNALRRARDLEIVDTARAMIAAAGEPT